MKHINNKIITKTLISLLPLFICFLSILCYVLITNDILISDGQGGVIRYSRFLLQLTVWYPVIVVSLVGSFLYYLNIRLKNKLLIVGSWVIAFMLGIIIFLYLCWNILLGIIFFPPNNFAVGLYFLSPYLILGAFIFSYLLFMKDSIKIFRKSAI